MIFGPIPHEIVLLAFLGAIGVSSLCLCYAIGADANARGANGALWGAFAVGLLPIAVPIYLLYRRRLSARATSPSAVERSLGSLGIGGTTAVVVSSLVSPPDPFSSLLYVVPLVLLFVPLAAIVCYEPGWRALVSGSRLWAPR